MLSAQRVLQAAAQRLKPLRVRQLRRHRLHGRRRHGGACALVLDVLVHVAGLFAAHPNFQPQVGLRQQGRLQPLGQARGRSLDDERECLVLELALGGDVLRVALGILPATPINSYMRISPLRAWRSRVTMPLVSAAGLSSSSAWVSLSCFSRRAISPLAAATMSASCPATGLSFEFASSSFPACLAS